MDLPAAKALAAPERALSAGARVDDCEIERVLAHNSFAVVYRAYDHSLRLHVAIKEYLPDALVLRASEDQVVLRARTHAQNFELGLQAFVGEAQTLARCDHPSLLRINRVLLRHGTAYRVMRYCPGPTLLAHRRALAEAPDEKTLRAWFDGLLGALQALHDEGCVHGAVSPGNILLLPGDRPLLLDFDAVRAALLSDRTQGLMAALEPCFLPIEQRGPPPDGSLGPWTDLYSLGATLRFCLSGQLPAPLSASPLEPARDGRQRSRPSPPAPADAASYLLTAIDACLAEAPQDRPQSVAEVRALLDPPRLDREASPARAAPPPPAARPTEPVVAIASVATAAPAPPPAARIEPVAPSAREPGGADAANARVFAELDLAFARVAAQANEDALAAPASPTAANGIAGTGLASAMAPEAESPRPMAAPAVRRHRRSGLWLAGAALLAVVALAAGAWWLGEERDDSAERAIAMAAAPMVTAAAPLLPEQPTSAGARQPEGSLARNVEPPPAAAPVPNAGSAEAGPTAAKPAADSPRALCGKRSGYALYQCMQTQCAKRSLAKHPQCVRLKQNQSLG